MTPPSSRAEQLNRECVVRSLDGARFSGLLDTTAENPGLSRALRLRSPSLLAPVPAFLSRRDRDAMASVIREVESLVQAEGFLRAALAQAPPISHLRFGPRGVFFGYDFHLTEGGPALIEINTNAGGAFLSLLLAECQSPPCPTLTTMRSEATPSAVTERALVAMFRREWQLQRGDAPLRTVAIVDECPAEQLLHPELLLCQAMLRRAGIGARILPPEGLTLRAGALFDGDAEIDLVYNRLTDFLLESPSVAPLRAAYEGGAVVLTPHPRAHATQADKGLLVWLSDDDWLRHQGVPEATRALFSARIPRTELVDAVRRERLWSEREGLYFKPIRGFGSGGVHRGDELTPETWAKVQDGDYVAQQLVRPNDRTLAVGGRPVPFQMDVRAYAYDGEIQLLGARLYRGSTTNLRTPGGGFAPVYLETDGTRTAGACWEDCPVRGARRDLPDDSQS